MNQLVDAEAIELTDELKKRINNTFSTQSSISYMPEVLLFLPIPALLVFISFLDKLGIPKSTTSFLWIILFSNALIFLFVFIRTAAGKPQNKRVLPTEYRLLSCRGQLILSSVESVKKSFCYLEEPCGNRTAVQLSGSSDFPMGEFGEAILIEEFIGEYLLLDFWSLNLNKSDEIKQPVMTIEQKSEIQ